VKDEGMFGEAVERTKISLIRESERERERAEKELLGH